jgi:hypothetical protein
MATPDPTPQEQPKRQVSLLVTVRLASVDQMTALEIDNRIRDIADDYGATVNTSQDNPLPNFLGQ